MEKGKKVYYKTNDDEKSGDFKDNPLYDFPGFSRYEETEHCGCQMAYFPDIDKYFWGEWEFQPCMPCLVLFLIGSSYLISIFISIPNFGYEWIFAYPILTFFFIMFVISYIRIIKVGPGYFPFYWGAKDLVKGNDTDSDKSFLLDDTSCPYDGIMTNSSQYRWGHRLKKPERSILARSARRIVLRPDHLCGWTTVWIGKRNHKLFILFNFYGMFYLLLFAIYTIRSVIRELTSFSNIVELIILAIYGLFSLSFFLLTVSFTVSSLCSLNHNITSWEEWNGYNKFDRGSCLKNMEDVFGPYESIWEWLKPVSPFTMYSNEELASEYNVL